MKQPNRTAAADLHRELFTAQPFKYSPLQLAEIVGRRHNMTAQQVCAAYWQVKQENDRKAARAALAEKIEHVFYGLLMFCTPVALAAAYWKA